ncbi:hypothetical protein FDA48_01480 [Clostridium botulinum]|nr:hypothetical protein [Clostridium botulinum]
MMDFSFYTNKNDVDIIEISEESYKKLADAGLDKIVDFKNININVEGDEYEINAAELTKENRHLIISFIEAIRQKELVILFKNMDNNPTIKEIRDKFNYIKYLTEIYSKLTCEDNIYFSYD